MEQTNLWYEKIWTPSTSYWDRERCVNVALLRGWLLVASVGRTLELWVMNWNMHSWCDVSPLDMTRIHGMVTGWVPLHAGCEFHVLHFVTRVGGDDCTCFAKEENFEWDLVYLHLGRRERGCAWPCACIWLSCFIRVWWFQIVSNRFHFQPYLEMTVYLTNIFGLQPPTR